MTRRTIMRTVMGMLGAAWLAAPVHGATVYYVDVGRSGLGLNTGTNWADAYTNLQSALSVARTNDQVWVAKGTYYPTYGTDRTVTFNLSKQVLLYGGFTNGGSMADRDWNANPTILSGDIGVPGVKTDNSHHVVTALNNYETIDGFTIRDGYAIGGVAPYGAGIYCGITTAAPSNILNCALLNNTAQYGGAIILYGPVTWRVLISNCVFVGNTATTGGGGMLTQNNSSPVITHCGFYDNYATVSGGGLYAMMVNSAALCDITCCRFLGNRTGWEGPLQRRSCFY